LGQDDGIDLDPVADELYGLAPSEFTARRDERAAEARRAGDKALAAEIKKLRRPTTGAWLANLLARERREQVAHLLDVGAALRRAQAKLAKDDLRRLSSERHRALNALEKEARDLAGQHGQAVSGAVAQELVATLEAALADEKAANAFRAGRLATGLHYSGFGPVALGSGPLDGPDRSDEPERLQRPGGPEGAEGPDRADGSRQAEGESERSIEQAERALATAERRAREERARLDEARGERDRRKAEITDLERRLRGLRKAEELAQGEVLTAEKALEAAKRGVVAARDDLARATEAVGQSPRPAR
jgi:hypothetical protein